MTAVNNHTNFNGANLAGLESVISTWAQSNLATGGSKEVNLTNTDTGAIGGLDVSGGAILDAESVINNASASDTDGQPLESFNIQMPDLPSDTEPIEPDNPDAPDNPSNMKILNLAGTYLELRNTSAAALAISGPAGRQVVSKDGSAVAYYTTVEPVNSQSSFEATASSNVATNTTADSFSSTNAATSSPALRYALDVSTHEKAAAASKIVDDAINDISAYRGVLGATQNRLEYTLKNYDNYCENLQAAESRIRDADMARTMMEYAKTNILQQVSQALLAQINQAPQAVLQLLR